MYRKPPTQHRFKKGQSGNPKGRPKSLDVDLFEILSSFIGYYLKLRQKIKLLAKKLRKIIETFSEYS